MDDLRLPGLRAASHAGVPVARDIFTRGLLDSADVAVEPAGHGPAHVAEALLHGLRKIPQRAAVAPLGEIDPATGPSAEKVAIVVQQLLDVVLKGDHFIVLLEFVVDFLLRDVPIQAVGAVLEELLVGQSPAVLRPVVNPPGAGASENFLVLR